MFHPGGIVGARSPKAPWPAKTEASPYHGLPVTEFADRTRELIASYPLSMDHLVDLVLTTWTDIFQSSLGASHLIGKHIFPSPQIMGSLLHELLPLAMLTEMPGTWSMPTDATMKDLVNLENDDFSTEIKTSSSSNQIYGNRSYGQQTGALGKKGKSGYYLAVNFAKWPVITERPVEEQIRPPITLIRFGWIDHTDWIPQASPTGQQASLSGIIENNQLLTFYRPD